MSETIELLQKQLGKTNKDLERYRAEAERLSVKYTALTNDFNEMTQKYNTSQRMRVTIETEVTGLRKEIDDLSSALFSQANDMVSTARRSEFEFKEKNRHLQNELSEKDLLIETYAQQLSQCKDIINEMESSHKNENNDDNDDNSTDNLKDDTESNENNSDDRRKDSEGSIVRNLLYSPPVQSLRYDLDFFENFVTFAKNRLNISNEETPEDFKDTRFYKRILHDDVQPTLKLDTAPGVSFLQKRSLMSAITNGRVIIEPIALVNESFKRNSAFVVGSSSASSSRPVATPDPCSICGEARNDTLQHARLYMLKIYSSKGQKKSKSANGSTSSLHDTNNNGSSSHINENTTNEFTYTFPLCAYCVFRIRSTCELYAFLRSVQAGGVWKFDTPVNERKAWIECTRIRIKMFWSRLGIWDSDSKIVDNKIFSADQVMGINNKHNTNEEYTANHSFEFQETKTSPENKRSSYFAIGSYVEKFGSSFSPATAKSDHGHVDRVSTPIVMEDETKDDDISESLGKISIKNENLEEVVDEKQSDKLEESEIKLKEVMEA